jgi:hypothetical protein
MIGRVVAGAGNAGVLPLIVVLVLEVTTEKSRGIFVGMINAGATVGVAVGAFLYGALVEPLGWVSFYLRSSKHNTDRRITAPVVLDSIAHRSRCRRGCISQSSSSCKAKGLRVYHHSR